MDLPDEELSPVDFKATKRTWIQYSKQGSKHFPLGIVTNFEWKDYSPAVFRNILELENIDYADYTLSVCGTEILREVSSPGKCGNLILLSKEDRFVIKTLQKSDLKVLLEMLPNYYRHLKKYEASLLTKLYGLHVVRPDGGLKVYFVVMSNIFQSDLQIHKRYDLKGSSKRRTVKDETIIYKDLDLDYCFYLDPLVRLQLLAQIKYDCEFLEAEGIMNYSFLLGIHTEASCQGSFNGRNSNTENKIFNDTIEGHKDVELTFADICKRIVRFGVKMPARAEWLPLNEVGSVSPKRTVRSEEECHNVLIYFGIVDFFQNYNVVKRIAHAYKSIQYDSKSISSVNPKLYSSRLQDFLSKVFLAEDSD